MHQTLGRTKKINLVLIAGKAGSGKTVIAEYLLKKLQENIELSRLSIQPLAKPIKDLAYAYFGWDGIKDARGRKLLQVIGTEAGRNYDEDIWVRKFDEQAGSELNYFVIADDWRFPNECKYFAKNFLYEITKVRVERSELLTEGVEYEHVSEQALPDGNKNPDEYDFVISNNGTVPELYDAVGNLLQHLRTKILFT